MQSCGGKGGDAVVVAERALSVLDCLEATLVSHHVASAGRTRSRQGLSRQVRGVLVSPSRMRVYDLLYVIHRLVLYRGNNHCQPSCKVSLHILFMAGFAGIPMAACNNVSRHTTIPAQAACCTGCHAWSTLTYACAPGTCSYECIGSSSGCLAYEPVGTQFLPLVTQSDKLSEVLAISAGRKPDAEVLSAATSEAAAADDGSGNLELIDLKAVVGPRCGGA